MNRPTRNTLLGVALCLSLSGIYSCKPTQAAPSDRTIVGVGFQSCGAWTEANPQDAQIMQAWVFGFLSAANLAFADRYKDFMAGKDAAAFKGWMTNYCRDNPLKPISAAAGELVNTLRGTPRR